MPTAAERRAFIRNCLRQNRSNNGGRMGMRTCFRRLARFSRGPRR